MVFEQTLTIFSPFDAKRDKTFIYIVFGKINCNIRKKVYQLIIVNLLELKSFS